MPREIPEIAVGPQPQTKSQAAAHALANQYAAIIAEHNIQNHALQQRRRGRTLPNWMAFAVAAGGAIALAFIYFLDH
jgi:hypothetical protein